VPLTALGICLGVAFLKLTAIQIGGGNFPENQAKGFWLKSPLAFQPSFGSFQKLRHHFPKIIIPLYDVMPRPILCIALPPMANKMNMQ